ncbi:MAG: glycine cleavage system aminomethyltransferase GcvT [Planctomycetales bacterium]|nr:glycine cleavage system aminomethyltransferase GcvT [Planctomycetales bacterium]
MADLKRTPLHAWHESRGARMVDFSGWSMPVQYTSIVAEHQATRRAATLFDVSHMGRFRFSGEGAADFLDHLTSRRVGDMRCGQVRYSLLTNESGGILDDVLVYYPAEVPPGHDDLRLMVVNAGNRKKIADWIDQHLAGQDTVTWSDETLDSAMIALQGPQALAVAQMHTDIDLSAMKYYTGRYARVADHDVFVSRTGYTGEDGIEISVSAAAAVHVWEILCDDERVSPAGLGARDTLRLEAAMPLYGHELDESIDPFQAGLAFAVNLQGRDFPGAEVLAKIAESGTTRQRVGFQLLGKRVPREHYVVLQGDDDVGIVTSGTFSPTLEVPIAMAYVDSTRADGNAGWSIDIRGQRVPAERVPLPFYQRH